jgi:heterotetrameric sarcosine oxidase delta subunit
MRILCPNCGERSVHEFAYRGDAGPTRPAASGASSDIAVYQSWIDYVYFRDNGAGSHREFWYHASGCRAWLIVTRNVTTHQIAQVEAAQ